MKTLSMSIRYRLRVLQGCKDPGDSQKNCIKQPCTVTLIFFSSVPVKFAKSMLEESKWSMMQHTVCKILLFILIDG